ncbi:ABC-2 type transport system ATP-binding protein [Bacillus ectoiniformans]|uniref:ABC transporter ATP-binding protein n=1 Tax=Bacillus ectoiniformans TaxID=1494429 RepID=UPI00195C58D2|nr:ABC transporter ATP-binding protein [Bacillus ectoiniformans]MBM7648463.1 ABC-2 type transport system ATP-binding protein [Bacillus ectoiniformans]
MQPIVHLNKVSKSFGVYEVLKEVSLNIHKGEIYGLLGPSGSGKTTMIKLMIGLERPSAGEVTVKGERLKAKELYPSIGYMAQSDALYNELTAKENLSFMASLYGMRKAERNQQIEKVMITVDLLEHLNKPVHQFSGGMKRRLSLAIALLHEPDILFLDEPTVGIDPVLRKDIWDGFHQLKEEGRTLIITTHVMDEAERCDRLGLLQHGEIISSDTPEAIKSQYGVTSIEDVFLKNGGVSVEN